MSVFVWGLHSRNDGHRPALVFCTRGSIVRSRRPLKQGVSHGPRYYPFFDEVTLESNQTVLSQATAHLETLRFLSHVRRAGERLLQGLSGRSRTNCPIASKHWVFLARHASSLKNDARVRLSPLALARRAPHQRMPDTQVFAAGQGMLQVGKTIDHDNKKIPLGLIHS